MFTITYAAALLSTSLVVGAVAFLFTQTNTRLTRTLALYCLTAACWIGGNAAADVSYTVEALTFTSTLAFVGGSLNLLLFLILVDLLIDQTMPSKRRLFLYALPTLGMTIFAFTEFAIVDTYFPLNAPAQIVPGPLYLVTLFILVGSLAYGIVRLISALRHEADERRRIQLSYVLLGLILSLLGEIVFDVLLPLLGELRFYTLGPIASIFFVLGCGYAITAHRLIDIRIGIHRGLVYFSLLSLIVLMYAGLLSFILWTSSAHSSTAIYVAGLITVVAGVLGTPIIERSFRRATAPIFFRDSYDYAEALHSLSEILYRHIELEDLVRESEKALTRIFRAEWVGINYSTDPGIDRPDFDAVRNGHILGIPISSNGTYVGSIHAGRKRGGNAYTAQDRRLLETFAYHAATAFSRAELYEKTKRHAKELEHTVEERTRELKEARDDERRMLIELSHNLQTPLAVFQTRLDQLKQSTVDGAAIRPLEQSLARLSGFIYDLLAIAKLEREKLTAPTQVDLSSLVTEIVEELTVIADNQGVSVESTITPNLLVTGDEKRLREAILNIASNALRYMRSEGPRSISFTLSKMQGEIDLFISDTGSGISSADLPHVCERFYRGAHAPNTPSGNGLGLSITKQIIERHGGTLVIESTIDVGTKVRVLLPTTPS